ncbi:hypothetical protein [Yersinia enterocolitica]|uniref:hypothetical protein n=1 Tax=Yersinia enterocolitica TaxID=630 RepID=UPI003D01F4EB
MSKLTVNEVKSGVEPVKTVSQETITDSLGRTLTLRKITPLLQSRITLGIGVQAAMNEAYMTAFVYPSAMVASIDSDEYRVPTSVIAVEAMLTILGDEGINALMEYFKKKHDEQVGDRSETEELAIKN